MKKGKKDYITITVKIKKKLIAVLALLIVIITVFLVVALTLPHKDKSEFNNIKIYLSPSNQSKNYYATGNTTEMEQCDLIAEKTAEILEDKGFDVKVGESGDSMENRCAESDEFGADLHIPIHTNALNGEYTGGTHVYVYSEANNAIAKSVLDTLGPISPGIDDRIEYKTDLYEITSTNATSVYIECEFHDTQKGSNWIINNKEKIAEAIADSVYNYYSDLENKKKK